MLILFSQSYDPAFNLATEQYLVESKKYQSPIVFLWQNQNTIVVGRNQNSAAEINLMMVEQDQVQVVRRNTGGGTVFHDLGNLCFSLIIDQEPNLKADEVFQLCLTPILTLLRKKGLNANFKGRNDLEIDGAKISGNAQLQTPDKILAHGTLLFDVDLAKLSKYLNVNPLKMKSKKVKSVQARVANIKDKLKMNLTMEEFKTEIAKSYDQNAKNLILDEDDQKQIEKIMVSKYQNWEWNYGKNESFASTQEFYFPNVGLIQVNFSIFEGEIAKIKFYGDFLGTQGTEKLEKTMIGLKYDFATLKNHFETFDLSKIFGSEFKNEMLIKLLFSTGGQDEILI